MSSARPAWSPLPASARQAQDSCVSYTQYVGHHRPRSSNGFGCVSGTTRNSRDWSPSLLSVDSNRPVSGGVRIHATAPQPGRLSVPPSGERRAWPYRRGRRRAKDCANQSVAGRKKNSSRSTKQRG
jgi:hypothetical protein